MGLLVFLLGNINYFLHLLIIHIEQSYNTYLRSYVNCFIDLHSMNVPFGTYPVIVMDTWQHAYYRDYLKDVKTYTYAMMKQLRWPLIERRIEKCDSILEAMK